MSKQLYTVEWPFEEVPRICPYYGKEKEYTMTFEDAKAEIIDWLERELEAAKQMQEEEHHAEDERQYWEDHCS